MTSQTITRRGVAVRPRNKFELYAWLFMRVSGLILIFMAVFHFLYMHFYLQVDNINFDVIAFRWQKPVWRAYDFVLLALGFTHGMNGARVVLEDYLPTRWRKPVLVIVFILFAVLILMGAWVIFTFKSP